MTNRPSSAPSRSHSHSFFGSVPFGQDIDLAVGLTSAAFGFNELYHATKDRRHRGRHLLKAGLASAVSAGAFTLMYKEHREEHREEHRRDRPRSRSGNRNRSKSRSKSRSRSRSRSRSPSRGRHRDDERFHSPPLRSRSSPDIEQDINSCHEGKLPHSDSVETQRGYFSDDESEVLSDGRRRRLPRMPFNYRRSTEKAIVRGWSGRQPGSGTDGHKNSSDDSDARRQREREARHHRSPSPSPPKHRNTDLG